MSNPWFRFYAEFLHDPKVRVMSEIDQLRLVLLFCLRCNGSVTLQDKHVTFSLRISDTEWKHTKDVFIESGFIDSDNNILNWNKRQYISDSSKTRVAKHRALHKPVTVTSGNVTVTPPEQNRTDTEHKKPLLANTSEFDRFWEAWPKSKRKGGRTDCVKFWKDKKLDSVSVQIISHVEYCKGNGVWRDEQFIEAPIVYLRAFKWDGAETASAGSSNGNESFLRRIGAIPS